MLPVKWWCCAGPGKGFFVPVLIWNISKSLQHNTFEKNLADSTHLMELFQMIYLSKRYSFPGLIGPALAGGLRTSFRM